MTTPSPESPRKCPACGAIVEPAADHCWFCREELGPPRSMEPPPSPAGAASSPLPAPPIAAEIVAEVRHESPHASTAPLPPPLFVEPKAEVAAPRRPIQFDIRAMLGIMVAVAIACALIVALQWIGVVLVAFPMPAVLYLVVAALRGRNEGRPMSPKEEIALFLKCLAVTALGALFFLGTLLGGMFMLCLSTPFILGWGGGMADGRIVVVAMLLGCIAASIFVTVKLWPRR